MTLPHESWRSRPVSLFGKPIRRLGLASHGSTALTADDVLFAVEQGVNFLNWAGLAEGPGEPEAFGQAIAQLGRRREEVVVCVQFGARTAAEAAEELRGVLSVLKTDTIDVLTCYYVEQAAEWDELAGSGGALAYLRAAQRDGLVRRVGITSHQRPLAARIAATGQIDVLMIRYNAAHRGAERDIFPTTDARQVPVIAYTALRWGALLAGAPDDPPGFVVPRAPAWYRWVLQSPSVAVVLAAPHDRAELEEDLQALAGGPLDAAEYAAMAEHGERVRRHAGTFR